MEFKVEVWPVNKPKAYDTNPRQITPEAINKTAMSIKEYGWRQPIVVDENNVIIAGHTRLLAAEKLGFDNVPVHIANGLTVEQKNGYRLADNRTGTESRWDLPLLGEELKLLDEKNFELALTGFDPTELKDLMGFNLDDDPYSDGEKGSMVGNFGVPPFSVLDTRQGYWQDRKRYWNDLIGDQGESRENTLAAKGSIMEDIGSVSILDAVLAELICRWFGKAEFNVFDCFAGDTVFGFVAGSGNMNFTGIELRKEQAELNNKRVKEAELSAVYINDDGLNMDKHIKDNSMDLFFSCPPYADLEIYSDDPNDLSNMSHDDFFKVYKKCLMNTYKKLKNNRFAVVVISEVRNKAGKYIGLVPATINFMEEAGYQYWNELILVNSAGTLPLRAAKPMHGSRKVGRMHQNVLVFFKGDSGQINKEFGDVVGTLNMEMSDA